MNKEDIKNLEQAAECCIDAQIELLRRLCTVDCGTGNIDGNAEIIRILTEFFSAAQISCETVDAGQYGKHLVARIVPKSSKGKIILNAHIDTVFKSGDVNINKFSIDAENWIHGCGVSDCKGGVVISAFAVKLLKELGLLPQYEIVLIYNCDEEIGSPSAKALLRKESENADCAVCFEPSRDEDGVLTARMGVGKARIEVTGKRAHPAMYWNGASATECLVKVLGRLYKKNKELKNIYYNATEIDSGPSGCMSPFSAANIGFRINADTPYYVSESLLKSLEENVPVVGCKVKVSVEQVTPYMERSKENVALYKFINALSKEHMDWDIPEHSTYGTGDANNLADCGVPTVCGMGSYMANPHTLDEKCRLDSLEPRTKLTALFIALFDKSVLK